MLTLFHMPLCPFSRKIRVALREKSVEFDLKPERPWERRDGFLALNPASETPVLVMADGAVVADSQAIAEYLEDTVRERPLIGVDPAVRAEVRRLIAWFDQKFYREVTQRLVGEKVLKRLSNRGTPDSRAIREGSENLHFHLEYISYLTEHRRWLAGDNFSLADIAAAAQISVIDFIGDVPWARHEPAKDWYALIKSRPSFRPLLADVVYGLPAASHYADLDF